MASKNIVWMQSFGCWGWNNGWGVENRRIWWNDQVRCSHMETWAGNGGNVGVWEIWGRVMVERFGLPQGLSKMCVEGGGGLNHERNCWQRGGWGESVKYGGGGVLVFGGGYGLRGGNVGQVVEQWFMDIACNAHNAVILSPTPKTSHIFPLFSNPRPTFSLSSQSFQRSCGSHVSHISPPPLGGSPQSQAAASGGDGLFCQTPPILRAPRKCTMGCDPSACIFSHVLQHDSTFENI